MSVGLELIGKGRTVRITCPDRPGQEVSARWLYDHGAGGRDPVSGQRGHGARALEAPIRIETVEVADGGLRALFAPSGETRWIAFDGLAADPEPERHPAEAWLTPAPIESATPVAFGAYLTSDEALREALSRVARHGLALISGAGLEPGTVEHAAQRFGFIRETNYGRLFDVRITPSPTNLAFSERGLELHTDNPYRDPVPTLQLLHAITADGEGGQTLFVDGFAHAEVMRLQAPEAFELLSKTPARFSFAGPSGARWTAAAPILSLDPSGAVACVRFNHRSLDLPHREAAETEPWYEAYLDFHRRVHTPEAAFERRLEPGDLVIFDNRRVLHGRRPIAGDSPRWLQGCYADRDGLDATLARLDASTSGEMADGCELRR